MTLTTLDIITRRTLLELSFPIHYYFEFLTHAATCLRELNIDTLQIVNTINLPISQDDFAGDLPDDFVDDIGAYIPVSGALKPIPKKDSISPLRLVGTDGSFMPYQTLEDRGQETFWGFWGGIWFWNANDYGEPVGRYFGSNGGSDTGYKIIKKNRQIQMTQGYPINNVILMYISDGQSVDAASQIDIAAIATIQAWINWKRSPNRDNDYSPEGRSFYNQKSKLKARMNDLTTTDIKDIIYSNYTAAPKV